MRSTPPADDPLRGIYYAALDIEGAVVEVFGDSERLIDPGSFRLVRLSLVEPLRLLDLRGRGGMVAGPTAGISGTENRALTQAWARFFYDRSDLYTSIDGVRYANSHNQLDAIAVFERGEHAIACARQFQIRLADPSLEPTLLRIAERNNLVLN